MDMMNFHSEYVLAAVLYTECFAGFLVNVIILAAIFLKWKTLRSLHAYYKILSCLVTSRSLYLLSIVFHSTISTFYPWVLLDMVNSVTLTTYLRFLHDTNLWFATVLCVFYCVKITSYNWKVLIFLKAKLSTIVPWFLLASVIISLSSGLLFVFYVYDLVQNNLPNRSVKNMTVYIDGPHIVFNKEFQMFLLGSYPPFLTICVTICLLLHSLWMHTRRMRSSGSSFQSPNLETHFSAVKSMSLFLVFQIMYFVAMNVILLYSLNYYKVWIFLSLIIACSSYFFHSLYMIFSNSELKKMCISMFKVLTRSDQC